MSYLYCAFREYVNDTIFSNMCLFQFLLGLAIGYSSMSGGTAIGEIQFADYIFPGKNHYGNSRIDLFPLVC